MKSFGEKLDILTNVAIVVVAVLVGSAVVKQYFMKPAHSAPPQVKVGQKVPVANVDWSQKSKHLILAISDSCHFCSESAPFYQRLMKQIQKHNDVHVMALMPQPVEDGVAYLKKLDVPVTDVHQVSFSSIPISGTPTILLVSSTGTVEKAWFGKLTPDAESEVMEGIGCKQGCN